MRETKEETGLTLTHYKYRGIVTFVSDVWETEYMHLFTADGFTGNLIECDEGDLEWIPREQLLSLPAWEGDKIFLNLLFDETQPFFSLKFIYEGDTLTFASKDGCTAALGILALSGANGSTTASGLFVRSMVCAFGAPACEVKMRAVPSLPYKIVRLSKYARPQMSCIRPQPALISANTL